MQFAKFIALSGFALLVPIAATAGPAGYYFTTGQSNANTQIDAADETDWLPTGSTQACLVTSCATYTVADLTPTFPWQLNGGILNIKVGNGATDSIYFDLWDVTNEAITGSPDNLVGDKIAEAVVPAVDVNTSSYTPTDFFFDIPVTLQVGESYVVTVTSNTSTNGSGQYFIKGADAISIQDSSSGGGNPLAPPADAPEPSSILMAIGGILFSGFRILARRPVLQH